MNNSLPISITKGKKQPKPILRQIQLDLFKQFYASNNDSPNYSNLIGLWDVMPRYSISKLLMNKLRDERGVLRPHYMDFQYRGETYSIEIQPASIKNRQKTAVNQLEVIDYYPSANEELVEEALRKIFIEKNTPLDTSLIVSFTIYELCEMLKRYGHTRSKIEVVQSLEILSKSKITVSKKAVNGKGKVYMVSSYLNDLVGLDYVQDDNEMPANWSARFHPLVAKAIELENYRQFDLKILMDYKTQIARWLHRLLIDKYIFASKLRPFEVRYSTVKRDSQMLNNYSRERDAIDTIASAFDEIKTAGIISSFKVENEYGVRGKIVDVVFILTPTTNFIHEVKAANKRMNHPEKDLSTGMIEDRN